MTEQYSEKAQRDESRLWPHQRCVKPEAHPGHKHVNEGPRGGCGLPEWCDGTPLCVCHGPDRPHAPHLPCDKGCQPDWHRDDCSVYITVPTPSIPPERTDDA